MLNCQNIVDLARKLLDFANKHLEIMFQIDHTEVRDVTAQRKSGPIASRRVNKYSEARFKKLSGPSGEWHCKNKKGKREKKKADDLWGLHAGKDKGTSERRGSETNFKFPLMSTWRSPFTRAHTHIHTCTHILAVVQTGSHIFLKLTGKENSAECF